MMRNLNPWILAIAVVMSACKPSTPAGRAREPLAPKTVKVARAELRPMDRVVVVTGSFHAREQSTLSVKVPGRLERISVDVGNIVKRGDELAQIERADYELRVKQAEAVLAQARATVGLPLTGDDDKIDIEQTPAILQAKALLDEAQKNRDRVKELNEQQIAPTSELDTAQSTYTVALTRYQEALEDVRSRLATVTQRRAELNIARKQFSDSTTRAPFDGIVQQRMANLGEYVQAGTPLLVMASVDPLRLRLEVPERESTHVRAGQRVRINVGGSTNIFEAKVTRVSPAIAAGNRMLLVEADVPAVEPLRPGLFAQAEIVVDESDPAICIPASAISSFVGIEKVFLAKDGKALEKNVTTGRRRGDVVEVLSGVEAGATVVLNPGRMRTDQPLILDNLRPEPAVTQVEKAEPAVSPSGANSGAAPSPAATAREEANAAAR